MKYTKTQTTYTYMHRANLNQKWLKFTAQQLHRIDSNNQSLHIPNMVYSIILVEISIWIHGSMWITLQKLWKSFCHCSISCESENFLDQKQEWKFYFMWKKKWKYYAWNREKKAQTFDIDARVYGIYSTIYCLSVLAQGHFGCYSSFPAKNWKYFITCCHGTVAHELVHI